jgi:hypothetical protein
MAALTNSLPAEVLRGRGLAEPSLEPAGYDGVKTGQGHP